MEKKMEIIEKNDKNYGKVLRELCEEVQCIRGK